MCVCGGQRAMTTAACALTGGFITASDRASSKTPSEEYTLCVGQNKHPASSEGAINYLYRRHSSGDTLNIPTCSSGRVKDDLCLMATLNFTAIGPCAFWGLGRHKVVVINCCSRPAAAWEGPDYSLEDASSTFVYSPHKHMVTAA